MFDRNPAGVACDRERRSRNSREFQLARARFERSNEMPVLNVVAESVEFDFGCVEERLGRAKEALRVIDDPELPKRRGVRNTRWPDAERFQRFDRACKERSGAVVRHGPWRD